METHFHALEKKGVPKIEALLRLKVAVTAIPLKVAVMTSE